MSVHILVEKVQWSLWIELWPALYTQVSFRRCSTKRCKRKKSICTQNNIGCKRLTKNITFSTEREREKEEKNRTERRPFAKHCKIFVLKLKQFSFHFYICFFWLACFICYLRTTMMILQQQENSFCFFLLFQYTAARDGECALCISIVGFKCAQQ